MGDSETLDRRWDCWAVHCWKFALGVLDPALKDRILGTAKTSTKAQVTIPIEVKKKFKLEVGDYVIFKEDNGNLILTKAVLKEV